MESKLVKFCDVKLAKYFLFSLVDFRCLTELNLHFVKLMCHRAKEDSIFITFVYKKVILFTKIFGNNLNVIS